MGSSQNSAAHLENMRHRRINRMKRQRAIEMGKPVDVSLKPMALSSGQKKELSGLQLHAHDHQKHQGAKRSRVSVLVSLGLHAIMVFIAAFYVVRTAQVNDDAVGIEFFEKVLEKRNPPIRKDVIKQKALPTEPLKPIVLPVPKVPVRPITSDSESSLGNATMGVVYSGPVADAANVNTSGMIGTLVPIRPPTFDTGDPTESIRPTFDEDGLGVIGEPPDPENIRDPDFTGGDAFKPTEIARRASFRIKVEPKYPSEAERAGKEGRVLLMATIGVDGKATDIEVKEDNVGFGCARAAIRALKASRFNPAKRGGENVPQTLTIPYAFKIEE